MDALKTKCNHGTLKHFLDLPYSTSKRYTTAVIVPVYCQGNYLCQAVESALIDDQSQIFIVSDGCPQSETHLLLKGLAKAHPYRVFVQETRNCGLSAARNKGIELALALNEQLQFVFPLDADNALSDYSMGSFRSALHEAPDASWAYPDITAFGFKSETWRAPQFSRIRQVYQNHCDAGSLIRAEVFRNGFFFDESMRSGYEDWEFFLRLTMAGRFGTHAGDVGFRYRVKPVSMLTETNKIADQVVRQMRRINRIHKEHKKLLELEHADRPRFLFINSGDGHRRLCTEVNIEPVAPGGRGMTGGASYRVLHSPALPQMLRKLDLLPGILLALQQMSSGSLTVGLSVQLARDPEEISLLRMPFDNAETNQSWSLIMSPMPAGDSERCASIECGAGLVMRLGAEHLGPELAQKVVLGNLNLHEFGRKSNLEVNRHSVGDLTACINRIPWAPSSKPDLSIAFAVPWIKLGGVDACVLSLAHALADQGVGVHLVVTEKSQIRTSHDRLRCFSTISWIPEDRDPQHRIEDFIGAISHVDAVVNAHSSLCYEVFARERAHLFQTHLAYLHVLDASLDGIPVGFPIMASRHVDSVDAYLSISEQMRAILESMDVPSERITLVPNAPIITRSVSPKPARTRDSGPLKVLYAGRLDRQKGIEMLNEVIACTPSVNATFRIIGNYVLNLQGLAANDDNELAGIHAIREPATHDLKLLKKAYEWADIVLNLTRWEGVPLSILDAMAAGCAVIATDVGAVHEILQHENTGFLIPYVNDHQVARETCSRIIHLSQNPAELNRIRQCAWVCSESRSWQKTAGVIKEIVTNATIH
ncbi:MAG: glycosyltransferase [Syntrophobacteraceae bacterium]